MTRMNGGSNNRIFLLVGTVIAVVLIALVVFALRPGGSASSGSNTFDLSGQPMQGQASAPVTMVVFEDFKCPNCKNFEQTIFPGIKSQFVDTGKLKVYDLNFPFIGPDSTTAAIAAECVLDQKGSAGYTQYSTLLFRAQGDEQTQWATPDKLVELGGYVDGIDTGKLRTCIVNQADKPKVDADIAQANKANVAGTPSVFVNGKFIQNFSLDNLTAAIRAAGG